MSEEVAQSLKDLVKQVNTLPVWMYRLEFVRRGALEENLKDAVYEAVVEAVRNSMRPSRRKSDAEGKSARPVNWVTNRSRIYIDACPQYPSKSSGRFPQRLSGELVEVVELRGLSYR